MLNRMEIHNTSGARPVARAERACQLATIQQATATVAAHSRTVTPVKSEQNPYMLAKWLITSDSVGIDVHNHYQPIQATSLPLSRTEHTTLIRVQFALMSRDKFYAIRQVRAWKQNRRTGSHNRVIRYPGGKRTTVSATASNSTTKHARL
ncbi:hypothetical protein CBL_04625 [Carabus blaptoides fortunei]